MNAIFSKVAEAIPQDDQKVIAMFTLAKGWEGKYRQIMLLGKQLPSLPQQYQQTEHQLTGCESLVWLHCSKNSEGLFFFAADSDARIIRGLIVIVLAAFNGKTATEINAFDVAQYFADLALLRHLSPSRNNGIHAIVNAIQDYAGSNVDSSGLV